MADHLDQTRVPFALIGAAALAVHGVSRSTLDIDLLELLNLPAEARLVWRTLVSGNA